MARLREQPPPPPPAPAAELTLTWRDFYDAEEPIPTDLGRDCHPYDPGAEEFSWRAVRAMRRLRAYREGEYADPYSGEPLTPRSTTHGH